ncbi:hypothetical protein [Flammeovirga sp. SJP92]|uniref:hypothetical protein n=1 Tax=Flammeovirga sp. SJP92 TaxID=1775430 RepID=UPI000786835B|nr:hypothetical protein [Flammeovirga sp. SJP92]KXX68658.1 hypothetical protein AVL50_23145 [Flammeovirga sp. SJP92]
MSTLDLKNLWQQQSSSQPNIEVVLEKAKAYRKKATQNIIIQNIVGVGTAIYLLFIAFYYDPELLLAKIGIGCGILSLIIYTVAVNKLYRLINEIGFDTDTMAYLDKLKEIKQKQRKIQTTTTSLYFLLFSLGLGLYMYEYLMALQPSYSIPFVIVTVAWVAVNWFYFRPKAIKKQTAKIDELIQYFSDIKS